ncbi:hypothetical protein [Clostridium butyricum]
MTSRINIGTKEIISDIQVLQHENEMLRKENEELRCKTNELKEKLMMPINDKNREIQELKSVIKTLSKLI